MTLDNIKRVCRCGHDIATHYVDADGPGDCLGMRCDCRRYRNENDPPDDEPAPITQPVPSSNPFRGKW